MRTEIEQTADGSHTLFVPELDEHYHSVNGAIQESTHIFINTGLNHCPKKDIRIFEVGFGTGLNAYLTALEAEKQQKKIHYTTIEAYPLPSELTEKLNYARQIDKSTQGLFDKLHTTEWEKDIQILPYFILHKIEADFKSFRLNELQDIDLVYFDAFAPDKQPDMWSQEIFDSLYQIMNRGGILVTYCAKGVIRRMMQQAGFTVERLPGPPGKREMLRATKE